MWASRFNARSLFAFLALLTFLFLLLLFDLPRHTKAVVFFEIVILMHVSTDEQIWVRNLEFIQACIVANRSTSDVQVDDFWTKFKKFIDSKFFNRLALAQFDMLKVFHDLRNRSD